MLLLETSLGAQASVRLCLISDSSARVAAKKHRDQRSECHLLDRNVIHVLQYRKAKIIIILIRTLILLYRPS